MRATVVRASARGVPCWCVRWRQDGRLGSTFCGHGDAGLRAARRLAAELDKLAVKRAGEKDGPPGPA